MRREFLIALFGSLTCAMAAFLLSLWPFRECSLEINRRTGSVHELRMTFFIPSRSLIKGSKISEFGQLTAADDFLSCRKMTRRFPWSGIGFDSNAMNEGILDLHQFLFSQLNEADLSGYDQEILRRVFEDRVVIWNKDLALPSIGLIIARVSNENLQLFGSEVHRRLWIQKPP